MIEVKGTKGNGDTFFLVRRRDRGCKKIRKHILDIFLEERRKQGQGDSGDDK